MLRLSTVRCILGNGLDLRGGHFLEGKCPLRRTGEKTPAIVMNDRDDDGDNGHGVAGVVIWIAFLL